VLNTIVGTYAFLPGRKPACANKWFDAVQLAVLIAVSPLFIFPKPRLWWILFLIPLLWLIRKIVKKRFVEPTPLNLPMFIFLAAILVTTLRAADFSHSLPKIAGTFFAIAFFYALIAVLKTGKLIHWAVSLFLAGGFFFSLVGLLGMPTFKVKHLHILMKIKDKLPRIDFGLPGAELGFAPTVVGGILLLIIPLFFVMVIHTWKHKKDTTGNKIFPVLLIVGLPVTGSVLLLTQARGAWAGLFISTVIMGLLFLFILMKKKKIYAAVLIGLVVVGIIAGIGIYSITHAGQLRPGLKQAEGTLLFRIQLWDLTVPVISDNPLWGIGLNNFRLIPEVRYFLSHPHNQFLDVAVELGIPALAAFLAILLAMGYMCIQVWRNSRDSRMRIAVLGLGWGQLAHLFFCLTDAIPPGAKVGILSWISLALITGIYNYNLSRQGREGSQRNE
jgi:putative inorganic carbon (HCO3(-)) transporter